MPQSPNLPSPQETQVPGKLLQQQRFAQHRCDAVATSIQSRKLSLNSVPIVLHAISYGAGPAQHVQKAAWTRARRPCLLDT